MDETFSPTPEPAADTEAPKAPPRKRARRAAPPRKRTQRKAPQDAAEKLANAATAGIDNKTKGGRPSNASKMEAGLVHLHVGAGAMLTVGGMMLGQPRMMATGQALDMQAEQCAAALAAWAEQNERVRKALEALTGVGGGLLVLTAYAPVLKAAVTGKAPEGAPDPLAQMIGGLDLGGLDLGAMFGGGNGSGAAAPV
jgi:hypothetical protein